MPSDHRLAFLIMAHTDPQHLSRLTSVLAASGDVFVHLDGKVGTDAFHERLSRQPEVHIVEPRVPVAWAGISQVDASLTLIRSAIAHYTDYGHLILLSGSCYPLKSPTEIEKFLGSHRGREFIRYIDMRESPEHYMRQINRKWFKEPFYRGKSGLMTFADKAFRKSLTNLGLANHWPRNLVPYFGSNWWAITSNCARYILRYLRDNPEYYSINKQTFSPDEHFFHTLIGNSRFHANATGLQPYQGRGTWRMANLHMIHPSLQKWYTLADWKEVTGSDKLFIRKVGTEESSALLDRIDMQLR
jgi:hypothetical protein